MKIIQKFICFVFGHNYIFIDGHENHHNKFKDFLCQRCGKLYQSQYDLP